MSLLTNVIFVRRRVDGGFDIASPPGVRTVTTMRDVFPLAADLLEEHGRKGALTILLLDEAQNFFLGEMNGEGGLGRSMKVFCGILRNARPIPWYRRTWPHLSVRGSIGKGRKTPVLAIGKGSSPGISARVPLLIDPEPLSITEAPPRGCLLGVVSSRVGKRPISLFSRVPSPKCFPGYPWKQGPSP